MSELKIRSENVEGAEVSWFAPICNGDDQYIGKHDPKYKSNWTNTSEIVLTAERNGFRNVLCPSSYQVGQDTMTFASALAPLTSTINLLPAIRCGEVHPPMLARAIATLDHILQGRLTLNIISSNMPGEDKSSKDRYQRSREVVEILKQCWTESQLKYEGQFYNFNIDNLKPVRPYQQNGGPLLYFGGYSEYGVELCAQHCDVYLMWPETENNLDGIMRRMSSKASENNRTVDYGLRVHVIVRETESEALDVTRNLMSHIDYERGKEIRNRALDARSLGVQRQSDMRNASDKDGFVENNLWTGIGRARSGCGAAIVGDPDQIVSKINDYIKMGMRSFIFSGYPHKDECDLFGKYVMPQLKTFSMPEVQSRKTSSLPHTPLAAGPRN